MQCRIFCLLILSYLFTTFSSTADQILVATNSTWRWAKGTAEASTPANAWRLPGFDDSSWLSGPAPFFYGEPLTPGTIITDMSGSYRCIFLRVPFQVPNPAAVSALKMRAMVDDGFVAWINGTEIARTNMQAGEPSVTGTFASAAASEPVPFAEYTLANPTGYLIAGTNVLTAQVFNNQINSSDLQWMAELFTPEADLTPPTVISQSPPPGIISSLTQITVTFSEPVAGVTFSDLLANGVSATDVTGSGSAYTWTFDPPAFGNVTISWNIDSQITDLGAPANAFNRTGPGATWQYSLVDNIAPAVTVMNPLPGTTVRSLTQLEATFSEAVIGVNASDLRINGSAAASVVGSGAGPYLFQFPQPPTGQVQVAWAATHGITDVANPPNAFAGGSWAYVLDPNFSVPAIRINEFLSASLNPNQLKDEDGELQDWIELLNQSPATVSLAGWSLTDDADDPDKWILPAVALAPGGHLVLFASGKDRNATGPGAKLHANFQLSSSGEFLGLFNNESPRVAVSSFRFPEQRNDYSYGYDSADQLRYFATPTPGAANGSSTIVGVIPPVAFNVERGFFEAPFQLVLTTPQPGATIRYTLDGSEPTASSGQIYSSPIQVSTLAIFRAAAFQANYLPSSVTTHSYLFLDQVLQQPANPPGYPTGSTVWGGQPADYEMDPEIVTNPAYAPLLKDALKALPVLSVVCKIDDMFGPANGIYTHTTSRGDAWEKPCSLELILPDSRTGFQVNCGIQIQGNANRTPGNQPKHAFRVTFKGDYGPGRLEYSLFPDSPVKSFNTLVLRSDYNNSWLHWDAGQRLRGQRTRDAFVKDSMRAMGSLASHNRYVHLYINGLYWGIYDPTERPDAEFAASYLGGDASEFDVVNEGAVKDGNNTAYSAMLAISNLADNNQLDLMKQYLDMTQFIDFMLLHFHVANLDWGLNKNWYTVRRRAAGEGFKYVPWDGERTFENTGDNRVSNTDVPSGLHTKLLANAEYRLEFADRVHKHFFNDGALMPSQMIARWQKRAAEMDLPIIAESARWGDYRRDVHVRGSAFLYTKNVHFLTEQNRLLTQYFPVRTANVLAQLRSAGLYPNVNAPSFSQHGGNVARGYNLSISAGAGTIYVTTDGSDPRNFGTSAVSPTANAYSGPLTLNSTTLVKARVLNGGVWSALNVASFNVDELITPLRITEIMYNPIGGDPYEFVEVQNVGALPLDVSGVRFSGITFAFPPVTTLAPGQVVVIANAASPAAFASRYPGVAVFGYFEGNLDNGGERLALIDAANHTIVSVDYNDRNGWPAAADGFGPSLEIVDPFGNPDDPANWRASASANGTAGVITPPPALPGVRLNEIMADNLAAVPNGATHPDWIELRNAGGSSVNLAGWSLTDSDDPRRFVFPAGTTIPANGYLVIWCDSDFASPGLHGGFGLDRQGENIRLFNSATNLIDAVSFGLQLADFTIGRLGAQNSWQLTQPTAGAVNTAALLAPSSDLIINEWLANSPPGGSDWIELYNRNTTRPAALQGLYFGTGDALFRFGALSFVAPSSFVQLFANEGSGANQLDFKLPALAGSIVLSDALGAELSRVTYGSQLENVSQGRLPNGAATIVSFPASSSPGASNYVVAYNGPVLNEIMARNRDAVRDSANRVADWVELRNPTGGAFNLSGMRLSDNPGNPAQWVFPTGVSIPANGYLVVWFDGSRAASLVAGGDLNTGRSLNGSSGGVYLFNAQGQPVSMIEYGFQIVDTSIGNSGGTWRLLVNPTPGAANTSPAALGNVTALKINEWMAAPSSGDDWFELYNNSDLPIDLTGMFLTDDLSIDGQQNTEVAPLSFIGPRGFVKWTADGSLSSGRDHVNFSLESQGEAIRLYTPALSIIDTVYFGAQTPGVSQGLLPDGAASVADFPQTPTPAASNFLPLQNAVINEVLSHTDLPFEDAIELYNPTGATAAIGGWFLSDSADDFKKFRIADGTTLGARGYRVFYENQINGGNGSLVPFSLNSARGDTVYLSAADAGGNLTGYRATATFGPAANGVSFGRFQTSVGVDFTAMSQPTFGVNNPSSVQNFRTGTGATNSYPLVGPVVINEVMYHSAEGAPDFEFIELHNVSGTSVTLYDGANPGNRWRLGGGVDFDFPASSALAPGAYLLVVDFDPATNAAALADFRAAYGVDAGIPIYGPYSGRLDNAGDTVELFKPDPPQTSGPDAGLVPYVLVDHVSFLDASPWPAAADGGGASLQRIAGTLYGNEPLNWKAEAPTAGRSNSDVATVPPVISTQPSGHTVIAGGTITLAVVASGTAPLSYQWRRDNVILPGATGTTLAINNAQSADAGSYIVVVTNLAGTITSQPAPVTILVPPAITAQPQSTSVIAGNSAVFSVTATGTAPFGYQWRFNGVNINNASSANLNLSNVQPAAAGNYSVVITNVAGSVTSQVAALTVNVPPAISSQPQSRLANPGDTVLFSVTATGTAPFTYQWRRNNANLPGQNNPTLSIANAQAANEGGYSAIVANSFGSVTSTVATLTITVPPQLTDTRVLGDGSVEVSFSGQLNLSYAVQTSIDLTNWATAATLIYTNTPMLYLDTNSAGIDRRFYRIRLEP